MYDDVYIQMSFNKLEVCSEVHTALNEQHSPLLHNHVYLKLLNMQSQNLVSYADGGVGVGDAGGIGGGGDGGVSGGALVGVIAAVTLIVILFATIFLVIVVAR